MVATEHRCFGCFESVEEADSCTKCGFSSKALESHTRLPLGYVSNNYVFGKILGKPGGFGITYLAWDTKLQTKVAIKEFFPTNLVTRSKDLISVIPDSSEHSAVFSEGLRGFLKEAQILARINHPNVVRVRTYFEENQTAYLVMDYYDGKPLHEYMEKQGLFEESEAVDLLMPLLEGLSQIHTQGILHRDIKPDNIYLTEMNRPILLDFGAARVAMGQRSQNMSVVLTPGFAPMEQYTSNGNQGTWTDVYACAATLYFMTTGQIPADAMERINEEVLVTPRKHKPVLTSHFSQTITNALALKPEDRPQTIIEFQQSLRVGKKQPTEDQKLEEVARIISCPSCQTMNRVKGSYALSSARCGKCDSLLLPRDFEAVVCTKCQSKNKIPKKATYKIARCGKCRNKLKI